MDLFCPICQHLMSGNTLNINKCYNCKTEFLTRVTKFGSIKVLEEFC